MQESEKKFSQDIKQVVILCGGRGIRLRPATDEIPKVLVELGGKPILEHILDFYRSKGFSKIILCLGYKAEMIKERYQDFFPEVEISFSDLGEKVSMLERIWALREQLDDKFFVSYGDTLIDLDIEGMINFHSKLNTQVTITAAKIRNPFGLITSDLGGRVTSFLEKPILTYYIGSFLMEHSALGKVSKQMLKEPDGQGLVNFFLSLVDSKQLAVFEHKGPQITFNTESERRLAEENLGQFYTFSEGG